MKKGTAHTVWMDDVWDQVESHYQRDNCSTKTNLLKRPCVSTLAIWTRNLPNTCPESSPMCWRESWEPWGNGWAPAVQAVGGPKPHGEYPGRWYRDRPG